MAEHDINLVTGQCSSVIAENQKVTFGTAGGGGFSPAVLTAAVGINKGQALKIADSVTSARANLVAKASSLDYPANVQAAAALSALDTVQSNLGFGGSPNHAAFGTFLQQASQHCKDSVQIKQSTNFLESVDYSSFGSGITDMGSMAERGLTGSLGSLTGAGAAMSATGSMFNGVDVKDFGSPLGLVKSLQTNKLANATGVNAKLAEAGVPLNDIDNPIYADKISQVMGSINDPAALTAASDQFGITNPFAGLPSYSGSDSSLYNTPTFLGGTSITPSDVPTGAVTIGSSSASTALGASLAPTVPEGGGGIQSLKDLSDPSKLAPPGDLAGFSGASALTQKFADMGAGKIANAEAAGAFFGAIKTAPTPVTTAAHSSLAGLMADLKPDIESMTGTGNGLYGVPDVKDMLQHVGGGPDIDALNSSSMDSTAILAFTSSISKSSSLLTAAGIDTSAPTPNNLGSCLNFATSLKKHGQDTLTGAAPMLEAMADTSTKYGESVKAAMAEGANDRLLAANGMPPLNTNPFAGLPSDPTANPMGDAAKMLGG